MTLVDRAEAMTSLLELVSNDPARMERFYKSELGPIEAHRRPEPLLRTLMAFLEHGQCTDNAAGAIGINRDTVRVHRYMIEELLGFPIGRRATHLHLALLFREHLRARHTYRS